MNESAHHLVGGLTVSLIQAELDTLEWSHGVNN